MREYFNSRMKLNSKMKRGQIWIETVIYTLIGLTLIGIVLGLITPKINQAKDAIVVEQTIESLSVLDDKILEALDWGQNNVRIAELTMRRGELFIDSPNDEIVFVIDELKKPYSQPGELIEYGRVNVLTEERGRTSIVKLFIDYKNLTNLTYGGQDVERKFSSATIPYKFFIRNLGDLNLTDGDNLFVLDIEEFAARAD